jgi:hypothetical protein
MTKRSSGELDAVLRELAHRGLAAEILQAKHVHVRWFDAGGRKQISLPRSSSDWRGPKNARALVRRLIEGDEK